MKRFYTTIVSVLIVILINTIQLFSRNFDDLALTPPMGWNSWNYFYCNVSESMIRAQADAMVNSGMKDAGYQYIIIDDCWQISRDNNGYIVADPTRFPSGIKALADYVHSKGLKFGIYSCAGTMTCAGRPGSKGYEYKDAEKYAEWGVDYLKYDWCYTEGQNSRQSYQLMRDALVAAGRPIVFSICEWGSTQPWLWARGIGHLWRTTGDIQANWASVTSLLDQQVSLEKYAGPGGWNDPDMLEVGNGAMTKGEYRAHFSLWCLLAAPLISGNDLRSMNTDVIEILTNIEVIAVNQDSLGIQGHKVRDDGDFEVWTKLLKKDSSQAVILFNRSSSQRQMSVKWQEIGFENDALLHVRDLWQHEDMGYFQDFYTANVPSHDVAMLRVWKAEAPSAAPSVTLISPADSTIFTLPTSIALSAQATDSDGSVTQVDFYANGEYIGMDETADDGWNFSWNYAIPGVYEITARAIDNTGISVTSDPYYIYLAPAAGPFYGSPITIPADIQAENYDGGGEGVGFHDTDSSNEFGFYRWEAVDIDKITSATSSFCVSAMKASEWLNYKVTIPSTDVYDISLRVSSSVRTAELHLEMDGIDISGAISVPYTGSRNWRTVTVAEIPLNAGTGDLRLHIDADDCKVDYLNIDYALKAIELPWQQKDIGATAAAGNAGVRGQTFIVTGSGNDVWDYVDEFHFVYQEISGNLEIQARVASLTETDPWAKAGVMIRNALDNNSIHAMMVMSAANGLAFQRRSSTGGGSSHTAGTNITAPYWVKLARLGSRITAYQSENGTNWTEVGTILLNMPDPVYVGLMVTAHNDGALCEAKFEKVELLHAGISVNETETTSPSSFTLHSAYPNPFNPATTITFELPRDSQVEVSILNLLGKKIRTLKEKQLKAGTHSIQWDAKDDGGNMVATGLYICKLQVNDDVQTMKLMFLK
ncbi:carbohydrate-binding protein [candidate division KSB1 bacterium]|nr:carbohydrate-binding protein [candidate division KSB1 bacterium]